jgi:hypothetical protein
MRHGSFEKVRGSEVIASFGVLNRAVTKSVPGGRVGSMIEQKYDGICLAFGCSKMQSASPVVVQAKGEKVCSSKL